MPIYEQNIVFVESQVMDDVPEGGGAATGRVIVDGQMNNVFEDISDLDRAYGRFNLRKIFVAVRTLDTDLYGGAKTVITALPEDDALGYTLFSNKDAFDTRQQAANRVEAYLYKGPTWHGYLLENHIAGMRAISVIQKNGTELPPVGRTLCLVSDEGLPTQKEQYVRITKVDVTERSFADGLNTIEGNGSFVRWVLTLQLSDALRYDFPGHEASRTDSSYKYTGGKTRIRDTAVADATRFYGAQRLKTPASIGDLGLRAESLYSRLVPSSQTELPVAAALPYAPSGIPIAAADEVTYAVNHNWTSDIALHLPNGCYPGSLAITVGSTVVTDQAGMLRAGGSDIGTIDYSNGVLTLATGNLNGSKTITYTPAGTALRTPQSAEIRVTQESRSLSYVGQIVPQPLSATLTISFMAQGRWYVLAEQGDGSIKGAEPSIGAGSLDLNTGAYIVTLGALPDVGSSIIVTWGVPTQEIARPYDTTVVSQIVDLELTSAEMVQPGTLSVGWMLDGVAKTAVAGTDLQLIGDAGGYISNTGDELIFAPHQLPEPGAQLTIDYIVGPKHEDSFAYPSRNPAGRLEVTATLGAIAPGSLEVEWNTDTDLSVLGVYTEAQLAAMGISIAAADSPVPPTPDWWSSPSWAYVDPIHIARDNGAGSIVLEGTVIGTVNYSTGEINFTPDRTIKLPRPVYSPDPISLNQSTTDDEDYSLYRIAYESLEYVDAPTLYPPDESGWVKLRYNTAGATTNRQKVVTWSPSFKVINEALTNIVPGSLTLAIGAGLPFGDNGQGLLREPTAGSYLTRGTISYVNGVVSLSSWEIGATNIVHRHACVTTAGDAISSAYIFRTAAAPLRPGSLSLTWGKPTGGTGSVTADTNGVINAAGVVGAVDYETGIVRLAFGDFVIAAGNESEPWYHASLVRGDGTIFKPAPIAMSSLRYSTVSYAFLPLDADILGIDPVRLPSDGRVPIYRPGDVVMVMHTAETAPATIGNGGTIDCGRTRIGWVRVIDATGASKSTGFTLDRATGIVTFTDVSDMTMPVKVRHTVGDLRQITDVQITGQLTLARPLTHNYPAGESIVASCLIHGDRRARVSSVWDQATWNGTWSDSLVGSEATATLDVIAHPIEVTNEGAETERWLLRWTSTTNVELIGERRGLVFSGPFTADIAPINPRTRNTDGTGGVPYLHIPVAANGGGWSTGNVVRINTVGALADLWIARSIQQSDEPLGDGADGVELYALGNIDRP